MGNSQDVTYRPSEAGSGWIVLAGDAACGRPFYLGSTLNGHIHDVVPLAHGSSWSNWDSEGTPLKKYVERYRLRTSAQGFRRSAQPFAANKTTSGSLTAMLSAANKTCSSLPPLPTGPKAGGHPPSPAGCPVVPVPPMCRLGVVGDFC